MPHGPSYRASPRLYASKTAIFRRSYKQYRLDRLAPGVLEELKKVNPKDEATGRRKRKHFQWLTSNVGYPKLREHLGAVVAIMKLSTDWHDFKAKLDRLCPPLGKPTQLSFEYADEDAEDTGKGL